MVNFDDALLEVASDENDTDLTDDLDEDEEEDGDELGDDSFGGIESDLEE